MIEKNRRIVIKLMEATHEEFAPFKKQLEKKHDLAFVSNKDTYYCEYKKEAYSELDKVKNHFEKQNKIFMFTEVIINTWK